MSVDIDDVDQTNEEIERYNEGIEQENVAVSETYAEWLLKTAKSAQRDALVCYFAGGFAISYGVGMLLVDPITLGLAAMLPIGAGMFCLHVGKRASNQAKQFRADAAIRSNDDG